MVEALLKSLHFEVDGVGELLETLGPAFGLLVHFFLEDKGSFHFVEENFLLGELVVFALPLFLLLGEELGLGKVGGYFLPKLDEFVLLPGC